MKAIFHYLDYREFLRDQFAFLKRTKRATHRSLMKKAGFNSPNFLKLVMDGKRNLSEESMPKIARVMGLQGEEVEFFSALVRFNQAKKFEKQDDAYRALKDFPHRQELKQLADGQLEYFSHWHNVAIRELTNVAGFQDDAEWIAQKLRQQISAAQVRKTLQLLDDLGLVTRNAKGRIRSSSARVSTGDEVAALAAYRFHQQMLQKAQEALESSPATLRDVSSLTVSISQAGFRKIKERLRQFRQEILALAERETKSDTVYQLNFQLFNLTENLWDALPPNPSKKS